MHRMRGSNPAVATAKEMAPYPRKRDLPEVEGMRRSESSLPARGKKEAIKPLGDATNSSFSRSLSDIWELESKKGVTDITNNLPMKPEEIIFDKDIELGDDKTLEDDIESTNTGSNKNISSDKRISFSHSAASYYNENLPLNHVSVLGPCKGINKLNGFLKERKDDIKAGVPGRYLRIVIGQDGSDVGSFVSSIMYAFFLNETQKNSQLCTIPVINIKRADLSMHPHIKWLLKSSWLDESNLVFIDEIDLSYYDLFGDLKLVLVNGHKLPAKLEGLKDSLVEIFSCKEVDSQYPSVEEITMAQDCSCCTIIAEKFAEISPEILGGQGFSRLLLSAILLDTANLTNDHCTTKDKCMVTLLIKGAGWFGCKGLYQTLRHKMHDISDLKVKDILRREFKKWTRVSGKPNSTGSRLAVSHIGMSSIGISVEQLLAHEDLASEEVLSFQESEKLRLLMIVSGYYDSKKNFKREILVSANTAELMINFLNFFDTNGTHLPVKALDQLDLKKEFRAFEIDNKLTSRRSLERLLEEFGGVLRQK